MARQAPVIEPRVPVMMSQAPVMVPQASAVMPQTPVMMPRASVKVTRAPVMMPRLLAGEALAELPQALAEVALEAVSATRRPPARVCKSSTSP